MKEDKPLLTRALYRKQHKKNKLQRDQLDEIAKKMQRTKEEKPIEQATEVDRELKRHNILEKPNLLVQYNRLLNRWLVTMMIILIIILCIQFFI